VSPLLNLIFDTYLFRRDFFLRLTPFFPASSCRWEHLFSGDDSKEEEAKAFFPAFDCVLVARPTQKPNFPLRAFFDIPSFFFLTNLERRPQQKKDAYRESCVSCLRSPQRAFGQSRGQRALFFLFSRASIPIPPSLSRTRVGGRVGARARVPTFLHLSPLRLDNYGFLRSGPRCFVELFGISERSFGSPL